MMHRRGPSDPTLPRPRPRPLMLHPAPRPAPSCCPLRPVGPHIPWRAGRSDAATNGFVPLPDGRLPDGDKDAKHIRDIFYRCGVGGRVCVRRTAGASMCEGGRCRGIVG